MTSQHILVPMESEQPKHILLTAKDTTVLFALYLALNLNTFILSILPVVFDLGSISLYFAVDDIIRIAEPVISLPLYAVLFYTGFKYARKTRYLVIWSVGIALYQQGAGLHSGSLMGKKVLRDVKSKESLESAVVEYGIFYLRDIWEHTVSHYMYAGGGVVVSIVMLVMMRSFSALQLDKTQWILFFSSALVYGVTIAAIAIQYPYGSIPGLVLTVGYGGSVLFYLKTKNDFKIYSNYIVIKYYLISYLVALFIIIPWSIANGVKGRNNAA